jgi:hypothetical protein
MKLGQCLLPFSSEPFVFLYAVEKRKIKLYETMILLVGLYECETWSLALTEEHGLGIFENRALNRIFGQKRDHVVGY